MSMKFAHYIKLSHAFLHNDTFYHESRRTKLKCEATSIIFAICISDYW